MKKQSPKTKRQNCGEIKIGKFTISLYEKNELWIFKDSGEGCDFDIVPLEKALEKFYDEHF
jgi:hypothetical protein